MNSPPSPSSLVPEPPKALLALWQGSRDTAVWTTLLFLIACIYRLRDGLPVLIPAGDTLVEILVVLGVAWFATVIACAMGATTLTDAFEGPERGLTSRVPDTLAVAAISGFLAFIALLFCRML
jgi:hypothetical protein